MKQCPFCGNVNDDQASVCSRCKAAIPHEEQKRSDEKPVKVSRKKTKE